MLALLKDEDIDGVLQAFAHWSKKMHSSGSHGRRSRGKADSQACQSKTGLWGTFSHKTGLPLPGDRPLVAKFNRGSHACL